MGSVPQHPFFLKVIKSLQQYDRHWVLPYITVMYSTGPLFLSVIWKEYMKDSPSEISRVRILMPDEYMNHSWSFFTHHAGNSWHRKDARFIFWVSMHTPSRIICKTLLLTSKDGSTLATPHPVWFPSCRRRRCLRLLDVYSDYAPTGPCHGLFRSTVLFAAHALYDALVALEGKQ